MSEISYVIEATPIDRSAKGSWKTIRRLMALSGKLQKGDFDPSAFAEFMDFIESRTSVPDGVKYTLDDALESATFDDMMALAQVITGEKDAEGEATSGG